MSGLTPHIYTSTRRSLFSLPLLIHAAKRALPYNRHEIYAPNFFPQSIGRDPDLKVRAVLCGLAHCRGASRPGCSITWNSRPMRRFLSAVFNRAGCHQWICGSIAGLLGGCIASWKAVYIRFRMPIPPPQRPISHYSSLSSSFPLSTMFAM
jgi:hypothetical protein